MPVISTLCFKTLRSIVRTMTRKLRSDEEFVICSVAAHFSGTWRAGENPPDAYLQAGHETTAVEISTLTQQVSDGHGGSKPRLSEDSTAIWLANALNDELQASVPDGMLVILTLASPILKARRVKTQLKGKISNLLSSARECEVVEDILGNRIGVQVVADDVPSGKKVAGIITSANSCPDIFKNVRYILEDRIVVKARKCSFLPFVGPKWLALLNDYWLADTDTYQQAFDSFPVDHPFEKILLVSGNGSVVVLRGKDNSAFHGTLRDKAAQCSRTPR